MDVKEYLKDCKKGNHDLIEVYKAKSYLVGKGDDVTRWCRLCGAIVIDLEKDGKLVGPGKVLNMMRPLVSGFL